MHGEAGHSYSRKLLQEKNFCKLLENKIFVGKISWIACLCHQKMLRA